MEKFTYYFWTFVLGSVLGVVIETLWCILKNKRVESRKGLIFGPFNPLYGVASVALTYSIKISFNQSIGNIFLIGVVVASLIEYICSYYQEKITGTVSWDYRDFKFNLHGRINLIYSIFWGVLTIFWARSCMPILDKFTGIFVGKEKLTIIAFILMALDCLISLAACIRRKHRKEKKYAKTKFEKHLDYFYDDEILDKVYANSKFTE